MKEGYLFSDDTIPETKDSSYQQKMQVIPRNAVPVYGDPPFGRHTAMRWDGSAN